MKYKSMNSPKGQKNSWCFGSLNSLGGLVNPQYIPGIPKNPPTAILDPSHSTRVWVALRLPFHLNLLHPDLEVYWSVVFTSDVSCCFFNLAAKENSTNHAVFEKSTVLFGVWCPSPFIQNR